MATAQALPDAAQLNESSSAPLLVLLAAMPDEQLQDICARLADVLPPSELLIAAHEHADSTSISGMRFVTAPAARPSWTLTAAEFTHAHQLAQTNQARAVLLLGPESVSLSDSTLSTLAEAVLSAPNDLAVPCYDLPPRSGLVNSAILYPLSRALFATRSRFPLALDLGLSTRMAARLANASQRFLSLNQSEAPIWPLNEAAAAGFTVTEVAAGTREFPHPADPDLHTILPLLAGSLFADIEAKAAFWQRPRQAQPTCSPVSSPDTEDSATDTASMLQAFRLGYTNLQEIWSLVLPPNSLLGIKRLSQLDAPAFRMPDNLWARIVYDFLIAWKLRTINRGHLLGALIPLYLAWVAGHFHTTSSGGISPEQHVESTAAAFEAEKPYLVSRWRWPDRFNP